MLAELVQTLCYGLYKYRSRVHFPPEAVTFLKITFFRNVILAVWYKSATVSEKSTGSHLQGRRSQQQIPQKYQVSTKLQNTTSQRTVIYKVTKKSPSCPIVVDLLLLR